MKFEKKLYRQIEGQTCIIFYFTLPTILANNNQYNA